MTYACPFRLCSFLTLEYPITFVDQYLTFITHSNNYTLVLMQGVVVQLVSTDAIRIASQYFFDAIAPCEYTNHLQLTSEKPALFVNCYKPQGSTRRIETTHLASANKTWLTTSRSMQGKRTQHAGLMNGTDGSAWSRTEIMRGDCFTRSKVYKVAPIPIHFPFISLHPRTLCFRNLRNLRPILTSNTHTEPVPACTFFR